MAGEIIARNPFVARKWRAVGVESADDLHSWDDFRRLPLTGKSELVADQAAHPPFGTNLTYALERYVRVHQTSGTSGMPLRWLDTQESWEWWARCWGFVLRGAGVGPADRVFFPFSFGCSSASGPASREPGRSARSRSPAAARTHRRAWPGW